MAGTSMITRYLQEWIRSVRPVTRIREDRLWEVDALRGIAILMMVVYHLTWDLYGLAGWDIPIYGLFWSTWQRITASLFIGLVGVSTHLRAERLRSRGKLTFGPYLRRALVIFTWGMVISLVTYLFQPDEFVRFGILHFIATSIVFTYPFLYAPLLALPVGGGILLLPRLLSWRHHWTWAEWLGLAEAPHAAFDYFPVIPWWGMTLLGLVAGVSLFPAGKRRVRLTQRPWPPFRWLQLAGQNALLIYLIHQPLLITALTLLGLIHW